MEAFALYLLKSVVWLAGFTLVFMLFLRNERFFVLNRIYLLGGILISFLFPLISIHYTVEIPLVRDFQIGNAIAGNIQDQGHKLIPDFKQILLVLYVSGVLFVLALILKQGTGVFRAIRKSEIISFHKTMIHELVHIRQKHWFDSSTTHRKKSANSFIITEYAFFIRHSRI